MKNRFYDLTVRAVRSRSGAPLYEVTENGVVGYIDAMAFAACQNEAIAALGRKELFFVGPKRARLVELIANVGEHENAPIFDCLGHNGESFVYVSGDVISPPGADGGQICFQPPREKGHRAGTVKQWIEHVAGPLAGHSICEFFMMIPYAGPLRAYTQRVQNFGWELVGQPGTGKSIMLQLMASACGGFLNQEDGNFGLSFSATAAGLECEMQYYSDLVMIIDEGNLFGLEQSRSARGKALTQLLMALGKGQEKHRWRTTPGTYRFVYATCSNEPLLQVIGGTSARSVTSAAADRLMTIPLIDRDHGVFDYVPDGYSDTGDFIADLIDAASRQHGVSMPHYLQGLVNLASVDRENFVRQVNHRVSEFRQTCAVDVTAGSARRVAESFGLVYAAGRLAQHLGALPASFDPLSSTLACYRLYRAASDVEVSAADVITDLLEDPRVVDLDEGYPRLSDAELADVRAFRCTNRRGQLELRIPASSITRVFRNWEVARRDDYELSRLLQRDGDHFSVKRKVRLNKQDDRVICLLLGDQVPCRKRCKPADDRAPGKRARRRRRR